MKFRKFISELNRRNVFKATIAYMAVAWVVMQIASVVLPAFNAPDYSLKALIYLLAIGLIFWIGFSWIYDLTPSGLQKTKDDSDDEETIRLTNKRLNKVIAGSLLLGVLLLVAISFWAGSRWEEGLFTPSNQRVAVIPFSYESSGEEEAYFKIGMTDELINELSKVDELIVLNQASTNVLNADLSTANMLVLNEIKRIDYLINGSIEYQSNKLTILIELKEKSDEEAIWQKRYTRDITEVKQLFAEVAIDVTKEMGIKVKPEVEALWANLRPVKVETYELYLKGKHYLSMSTKEQRARGLVYLEEAIDRNPADPNAWAGLAEGYVMLGHGPSPPPDVFPKALAAAQRAIQLDSTNAEGWAALSHYHTYFGMDWKLAEYAFDRANRLNPNMAYNHYHRAWYLFLFGHMNEAIIEHKKAQELDPFTPLHTAWLGELYRCAGLYEEGLIEAEKAIQMQDNNAYGMLVKGRILVDQGKIDEGLELLKQASIIAPGWRYYGYGPALIQSGKKEEANIIIKELESMPPSPFFNLCLGVMYTESGMYDKAIETFQYEHKHGWYPWIRVYITQDHFSQEPRLLELVREMNLPDPSPVIYN